MADFYRRACKFCGYSIRMARMENGQWLPFDDIGKHSCSAVATASPQTYIPKPNVNVPSVRRTYMATKVQQRSSNFWLFALLMLFIWLLALALG